MPPPHQHHCHRHKSRGQRLGDLAAAGCSKGGRLVVADLLHLFSRIRVIYNQNPILHNQWEWVIYNRRERVPICSPLFCFWPFFVINIPIFPRLFIIGTLIINNLNIFPIIYNRELLLIIYKHWNQRSIMYNQVLNFLQSRYEVIINNHDVVLVIYNSRYIIYNASRVINNQVVQIVFFINMVSL